MDFDLLKFQQLADFGKGMFRKYPATEYANELRIDDEVAALYAYVTVMKDLNNGMVNSLSQLSEWLEEFARLFDGHLTRTVEQVLMSWQDSGFLNLIINDAIQAQTDELEKEFQKLRDLVGTLGASATFKGQATTVQIDAMTGMEVGDEWFDTTKNVNVRWNGTQWINVGGTIKLGVGSVKNENLANKSTTPDKTSFFVDNPDNLIDVYDFIPGYVDATGKIVEGGASRVMKTKKPLNPNSVYRLQSRFALTGATVYVAMYNQEGVFTRRFNPANDINESTLHSYITGIHDHQFIISCIAGVENNLFFHEGTNLLPFEEPLIIDEKFLPSKKESVATDKQNDLVETIKKHNSTGNSLKAQVIGDRLFYVYQPIGEGKTIRHSFTKDGNDDFVVYDSAVVGTMTNNIFNQIEYIMAGSNKEFAFRLKPKGSTEATRWFPEHEFIGTAFARRQSILFDGREKVQEKTTGQIEDVRTVSLIQEMNLVFPNRLDPVARLNIVTTINEDGVTYNGFVEWLTDVEIERGYVAMLPTVVPPFDTLRTSQWNDYSATIATGTTNLEQNLSTSFAFINTSNSKNYVLAQTIQYPEKTFRVGEKGRKEPNMIWLEHRSASVQKLYPQIYLNHQAKQGETLSFGSNIFIGVLQLAGEMLY